MDKTNKENPISKLDENRIEKSNFINDQIKEKEINEYDIEKSHFNNKMNQMNSMMEQMNMNNLMMMNNSMMMNNPMMMKMMN